ncbi:MAG: 7-carboxy-7-deazaguanine synthase QueE [bacterium]
MTNHANLVEIFSSIQGEGPYIGIKQLFIRFSGCNLKCNYCDTAFIADSNCNVFYDENPTLYKNPINIDALIKIADKFLSKVKHHSVSLTGGEPLLEKDFLINFLPIFKESFPDVKVYLETNGTLYDELKEVLPFIDIISADIKLQSSTDQPFPYSEHKNFIETSLNFQKDIFVKAVVSSKIKDEEITEICDLLDETAHIPLILQPVWSENKELTLKSSQLVEIQDKFLSRLNDVRIIPQTHKYLNLL